MGEMPQASTTLYTTIHNRPVFHDFQGVSHRRPAVANLAPTFARRLSRSKTSGSHDHGGIDVIRIVGACLGRYCVMRTEAPGRQHHHSAACTGKSFLTREKVMAAESPGDCPSPGASSRM